MALVVTPSLPLTTDIISAPSTRGSRDYVADVTPYIELSESLATGVLNKVTSSDVSVVEVESYQVNTAVMGSIAIGKGIMFRLRAKAAAVNQQFPLTVTWDGDSGNDGTGNIEIQLVDRIR